MAMASIFQLVASASENRLVSRSFNCSNVLVYISFALEHPNSYDVQTQIFQRLKSALAKAIRPKMYATHSVLCASGISASIDQNTGAITYSEDSLLDNYTRDAFTHAAMIYSSKVAKALMCKRSYMTAMANINDPTGCFRYGWNLNSNADKSVLSEFKAKLDNAEYKNVKEMYTRTLKQLDALDKNLLTDSKTAGGTPTRLPLWLLS